MPAGKALNSCWQLTIVGTNIRRRVVIQIVGGFSCRVGPKGLLGCGIQFSGPDVSTNCQQGRCEKAGAKQPRKQIDMPGSL